MENLCFLNPCLNGGTCMEVMGSHSCLCMEGFSGAACESKWRYSVLSEISTLNPSNPSVVSNVKKHRVPVSNSFFQLKANVEAIRAEMEEHVSTITTRTRVRVWQDFQESTAKVSEVENNAARMQWYFRDIISVWFSQSPIYGIRNMK